MGVSQYPQPAGSAPLGTLPGGYVQVTANQGPITTQVDLTGLTVTVTVGTGRRIKITGLSLLQSSVADDTASMFIMEGATQLTQNNVLCRPAGVSGTSFCQVIIQPASGSHTYKLQASRAVGTGNVTMVAGATFPSFILVEDIGV